MRFVERVLLLMSIWSISHRTVRGDDTKSGLAEWWSKNVDTCEWEGVPGRCVPPEECISTSQFVPGLVHPQVHKQFKDQEQVPWYHFSCNCSTAGSALNEGVCCTDCLNVFNFNPAKQKASDLLIDPKAGIHYKTGQKSWDKCIEWHQRYSYYCTFSVEAKRKKTIRSSNQHSFEPGVFNVSDDFFNQECYQYFLLAKSPVGGKEVQRGEFPHMVLLGYERSSSPLEWLCAGALVNEWFVLTAAHCLHSNSLGVVNQMAAGVLKRSDEERYWRRRRVARTFRHPKYQPPLKYHDIALLQADKPFELGDDVLPACLPVLPPKYVNDEEPSTVAGWGSLGRGRPVADHMMKVYLYKLNSSECDTLYPAGKHSQFLQGIDAATQFCYGYRAGDDVRDSCEGDSGGPLFADTEQPNCGLTLLGVTSFGAKCGREGEAKRTTGGVYTRVEAYLPWIESIIWNDTYTTTIA